MAGAWLLLSSCPRHLVRRSILLVLGGLTAFQIAPGASPEPEMVPHREIPPVGLPTPGDAQTLQERPRHEFYFTRAAYSGVRGWFGQPSWSTDYPKADRQFITVVRRLVDLDAYELENAVRLDDPELRRFPFLYALEVGYMTLTPAEVAGLREYLQAGGFLVIDDFWGTREWANLEAEMRRVFPDRPIVELEPDHPVFSVFYDIDEVLQVPAYGRGRWGGATHERDGYVPRVRGIFDEAGRLMVLINWNTDLGDAWEWAEQPDYPLVYSTFAYEMGVNMIVYAMSH